MLLSREALVTIRDTSLTNLPRDLDNWEYFIELYRTFLEESPFYAEYDVSKHDVGFRGTVEDCKKMSPVWLSLDEILLLFDKTDVHCSHS